MLLNYKLGCPVANGEASCTRMCGGNWPGTRITAEQMHRALHSGRLDYNKLGCSVLIEQAKNYLEEAYGRIQGDQE
jgi:hypothetical protein